MLWPAQQEIPGSIRSAKEIEFTKYESSACIYKLGAPSQLVKVKLGAPSQLVKVKVHVLRQMS